MGFRHLFVAVTAAGFALPTGQAQSQGAPVTLAGEWAVEQQVRARWIHGRQLPRFTPFKVYRVWLIVDSLRASEVERLIYLSLGRTGAGRDSAFISADRAGRIKRVHVGFAPVVWRPGFPGDPAFWLHPQRFQGFDDNLALGESRVWDLVPTFTRETPQAGLTWTDTIARVASDGPSFRQTVRGVRTSRIARDTVVDGRRLWIIRDSARVQYEARYLDRERTLDTMVNVSRSAAGIIRGVHLYDPAVGLFRRRDDTTSLVGEAVLRYPDGRAFRTPARYESTRRWDLYDAPQYAARMAQLRDESRRERGGMVVVPANELQRRLGEGDVQVRDSLLGAWFAAEAPDEAARLVGLLMGWVRDPGFRAGVDSLRLTAGDTTHLHAMLTSRAYTRVRPFDTSDVRAMLRFMEDPATPWGFNVDRDPLYENLAQALTTWPRAAMVPGAVTYAACTVEACELLAAQWRTASEARTRDVGLVALFSLNPARWADTVLALAGPRRPLLSRAATLAKGIGATWDAASKAVLPSPGSDWRAWLEWMDGRDSLYLAGRAAMLGAAPAGLPERMRGDTVARVRFDESHRTAIRMYSLRTGRDVTGELQRAYAAAQSDSARLVFGTMLQGFGRLGLSEDEIVTGLTSGDPARLALARSALLANFGIAARPMEPEAAAPFIDHLLAVALDTAKSWRPLGPRAQRPAPPPPPPPPPPPGARVPRPERPRFFVNSEGVPEAVRAKWSGRVEFISPAQLRQRDPREARSFYTIGPSRAWGRFVRVEVNISGTLARSAGETPHHYASGSTYYLMELNGEWVVVEASAWIT